MSLHDRLPEVGNSAMDPSDIDDEELRLLIATHNGPNIGKVVIKSIGDDVITSANITFDHQKIGTMLNPDSRRGPDQSEAILHDGLSEEQAALLKNMQEWRENSEIDFL